MAADHRANLRGPPSPQHLRLRLPQDWAEIAKDLKPVYTAPSEQAALDRFAEFSDKWEKRYPAIIRLWTNA